MAELVQIRAGRQVRHDVSLIAPWSAAGPEESVISSACCPVMEVDSVLPADPAAPSRAWRSWYPGLRAGQAQGRYTASELGAGSLSSTAAGVSPVRRG